MAFLSFAGTALTAGFAAAVALFHWRDRRRYYFYFNHRLTLPLLIFPAAVLNIAFFGALLAAAVFVKAVL